MTCLILELFCYTGIVADIKNTFLQIAIYEDQRDFLRMMWYKNAFAKNPTVKTLHFARVVFGLNSSPFILNGTVRIHLQKYLCEENIKDIIQKLIGDFSTNQKVLCLTWCTEYDTFVFDLKNLVTLAEVLKPTKRNILRISAKFMIQLV